jgi:predicted RNA-binding protein
MKTKDIIYTQHDEHRDWISKLKFYEDEILILKNRLSEIVSKNSQKDVLAQAEHFQNQFVVQKENIDEISHSITVDEDMIQKAVDKKPKDIGQLNTEPHSKEKVEMESFEKNFNELRAEFNKFASKWI